MPAPCTDWLTGADVADCCEAATDTSGASYEIAATSASEILFELSGRQFAGSCSKTVRPCRTRACGCDFQVLSRGHVVESGWGGSSWYCNGMSCGCRGLSRVRLSGYPVSSITQVKIDGDVVDPDTYRLDEHRFLTRVRELDTDDVLLWPSCQSLDLPDTQDGTFSVTYAYGQDPPLSGVDAAAQLACEIYKACAGAECAIPAGAVRIVRQGITIERGTFRRDLRTGAWVTGLSLVDAFLSAVNPQGLSRRPAIWSPASHLRFARPVGSAPLGT